MIPVPRVLSAGCGLAWCADVDKRDGLLKIMQEAGLAQEAMHEVMV